MGKKGKWFSAVKKVFSSSDPDGKEAKAEKADKSKSRRKWPFGKSKHSDPSTSTVSGTAPVAPLPPPPPTQPTQPHSQEIKDVKPVETDSEQSNHAYSVALASAVAAEAAAVAAQAAAEVVRLTAVTTPTQKMPVSSREELAATKIQTAFRGYLARRALRALRGLVRLKSLVDGNAVKRQTAHTLHCTQTMTRVQTQIYSRRVKMEEEKQALQRQLQLKQQRELEKMKIDEDWDHSHQSKEQVEASLMMKQEAALRRERALAYAFSHQWRNSGRSITPTFTEPGNPNWGWSWMERWMTARPWESRVVSDKDPEDHDLTNVRTSLPRAISIQRPAKPNKSSRPPSRQSPSTPPSKAPSVAGKIRPASPRASWLYKEDDMRSITSIRSERPRRQSTGGASVRDDASLTSTPPLPSYMQSTESARAKSRYRSLLTEKLEVPERAPLVHSVVKKRLSFPVVDKPSIVPTEKLKERGRRHSDPPKVDPASLKDVPVA
ncbi:protein IQ-DOMAIN 3-like [Phragmites australis]|uniref:protein IQ-DOMAIN 3-like n=1 Tax=Phragmites australis TaxID=29695 RepID=UPI002D76A211|nr:protein IQ-DOMAIN 3-like [Phragmites australis]XP_062225164.1 protein IQ-DOMAIN 3-like [Phragmites australis]XP_062225172.1 protein IQ-DOMAIN 3-like [Phragmites australis]XP_062225178.1 protein IQ-DOMAIN 3-like [Phragmites australis]XP_062225184.1 protein IQ-DOMAIN 3-like [Phragmites australis]XP_062225192.1 protein IQ-DOMAIN 3-like [Phragmites australis]XP_062225201.1 protein IQ-DOMAIN 3-like [Phragmites australis]XP_062225209.1 protein IQ-DOMAIN 3-like [Phragmites australis]